MDENEKALRLEKEKENLVKKMEEMQKIMQRCKKRMEKKQQEARDLAPLLVWKARGKKDQFPAGCRNEKIS